MQSFKSYLIPTSYSQIFPYQLEQVLMNTLIVSLIVSRSLQKKGKQRSNKKSKDRLEQTLFVNIYAKKSEHSWRSILNLGISKCWLWYQKSKNIKLSRSITLGLKPTLCQSETLKWCFFTRSVPCYKRTSRVYHTARTTLHVSKWSLWPLPHSFVFLKNHFATTAPIKYLITTLIRQLMDASVTFEAIVAEWSSALDSSYGVSG